MTILLSDERVRALAVVESGEPLVRLPRSLSPSCALVRGGLADRLMAADLQLPPGIRLRVVEGYRPVEEQRAIIASYAEQVRAHHPGADDAELVRLVSRFVSPVDVAPHVPAPRSTSRWSTCAARSSTWAPGSTRRPRRATAAATSPLTASAPTPAPPRPARDRAGAAGAGELPDRVVALELRRPLLGPDDGRPARALRPALGGGGGMTSLAVRGRTTAAAGPRLDIDLDAVARNTRLLADRAAGELMAVVKADGFGHGAVDVARTALAHGATRLGVTSLDEAWPLRDAGLGVPVLSWLNPVDADYATAAERDIDVAVPSLQHLTAVAAAPGRSRIHLHLDAGMARDGADPATWGPLCRAARRAELRGEVEVVGVMGHLGCADDPDDECNALGRTRFAWALETARAAGLRPRERHLAATSATLTDPRSHHTMSRSAPAWSASTRPARPPSTPR